MVKERDKEISDDEEEKEEKKEEEKKEEKEDKEEDKVQQCSTSSYSVGLIMLFRGEQGTTNL